MNERPPSPSSPATGSRRGTVVAGGLSGASQLAVHGGPCPFCGGRGNRLRSGKLEIYIVRCNVCKGTGAVNTLVSDPEPATSTSKVANPKDSLHQPVVLGMGSKTILPEGR